MLDLGEKRPRLLLVHLDGEGRRSFRPPIYPNAAASSGVRYRCSRTFHSPCGVGRSPIGRFP